jgi:hypothetical protein
VSEEKKGHVKVTMEVEINEAMMEAMKEGMKNMPMRWRAIREMGENKE